LFIYKNPYLFSQFGIQTRIVTDNLTIQALDVYIPYIMEDELLFKDPGASFIEITSKFLRKQKISDYRASVTTEVSIFL
jgi:hypothetical protein